MITDYFSFGCISVGLGFKLYFVTKCEISARFALDPKSLNLLGSGDNLVSFTPAPGQLSLLLSTNLKVERYPKCHDD